MKVASVRPFFNAIIGELLFTKEDWTPCRYGPPVIPYWTTDALILSGGRSLINQMADRFAIATRHYANSI